MSNSSSKSSQAKTAAESHNAGIAIREWILIMLTVFTIGFSILNSYGSSEDTRKLIEIYATQAKAAQKLAFVASDQLKINLAQKDSLERMAQAGKDQAKSTRESSKYLERQAFANKESARYQGISSESTRRLVRESKEANRISDDAVYQANRPWIAVSEISLIYNKEKEFYTLFHIIKNFGKTPGTSIVTNVYIEFLKDREKITLPGSCIEPGCQRANLFSDQTFRNSVFLMKDKLNPDIVEKIKKGEITIFVNFLVQYNDGFGYSHITRNCAFFDHDIPLSKPCQFDNEVT